MLRHNYRSPGKNFPDCHKYYTAQKPLETPKTHYHNLCTQELWQQMQELW
jgi:hypothetical protein